MTDIERDIASQKDEQVETGSMSASLMDETNTNKVMPNKKSLTGKKLIAAVGLGVLTTGVITGACVSSMRSNPAVMQLQTTYTGSAYTGTATLNATNANDVAIQNNATQAAGITSQRCNTNNYGQCPSASGPAITPPTSPEAGNYWPWGVAYAAIGFNIVAGNPVSIDYGEDNTSWGNQIFNVVYPSEVNAFGVYAPTGFEVLPVGKCEMTNGSSMFNGMSSYVSQVSHSYGGDVGAYGVTFGASHTSATYQNQFQHEFKTLHVEYMYCTLYQTELEYYPPPDFSSQFTFGVNTLPMNYTAEPYMLFYNEFGTHFIDKADFGSAYFMNSVTDDSFVAASKTHSSSTGVNLGVAEDHVKGGLNYNASHFSNNTNNDMQNQSMDRNVSIGLDPLPKQLNSNQWLTQSYTYAMPFYYEVYPIYDLFYNEDVCKYLFPSKDCTTLRANLITAAQDYCEFIQANTVNQVAYCGAPPEDPSFGPGAFTTNYQTGGWNAWMYPMKATTSTWYVAYGSKKDGMVAMCVEDVYGGQNCDDDEANGEQLQEVNVPGPLVCVQVSFRTKGSHNKNSSIQDVNFGYLNESLTVSWTGWALGVDGYDEIINCTTNGIILGLRTNFNDNDGYTVGDIQVYNECLPGGCGNSQNADFTFDYSAWTS